MEQYIVCPITQMIMSEPVIASDGHIYERVAILRWIKNHKQSPVTREKLDGRLYPAMSCIAMIDDFLKKHPERQKDVYITVKTCEEHLDKIHRIMRDGKYPDLLQYTKFDLELLDPTVLYEFLMNCKDNEVIEHFIEEQVTYECSDSNGRNLLHLMCYRGDREQVYKVLDLDEVAVIEEDDNGSQPIHFACQNCDHIIIRELFKRGADVQARNRWEITPLHYIFHGVKEATLEEIDLLISKGASLHAEDIDGNKPIGWAFRSQSMDIILHLIDHAKNIGYCISKEEMGFLFQNKNLDVGEISEIMRIITKC